MVKVPAQMLCWEKKPQTEQIIINNHLLYTLSVALQFAAHKHSLFLQSLETRLHTPQHNLLLQELTTCT